MTMQMEGGARSLQTVYVLMVLGESSSPDVYVNLALAKSAAEKRVGESLRWNDDAPYLASVFRNVDFIIHVATVHETV